MCQPPHKAWEIVLNSPAPDFSPEDTTEVTRSRGVMWTQFKLILKWLFQEQTCGGQARGVGEGKGPSGRLGLADAAVIHGGDDKQDPTVELLRTTFKVLGWTIMERLIKKECIHMHNRIALLCGRNWHNMVNQLSFSNDKNKGTVSFIYVE